MASMRIALVSPYSWTYPGGVTRHIEALAERFHADGHYVRVLAPFDPPDRLGTALHRGARPQRALRRDNPLIHFVVRQTEVPIGQRLPLADALLLNVGEQLDVHRSS